MEPAERILVRYERLKDIVTLAIRMQGLRGGLTLDDIQAEFGVSRRTAERMRDAVEGAFAPLETVECGDNKRHGRLRSDALRRLVPLSAEELAELGSAADTLERTGFEPRAAALRELDTKLRATQHTDSLERIEGDIEALVQAEGLAMRPRPQAAPRQGPAHAPARGHCHLPHRPRSATCRSPRTGGAASASSPTACSTATAPSCSDERTGKHDMRLWRLGYMSEARVTGGTFTRDPAFHLEAYARRSFGTFQEEPVDVVLCLAAEAKRDAAAFLFHPSQSVKECDDGTLTVRFTAGGIDEMCWHLVTWGESVTVEQPPRLRDCLEAMCASLAAHHGSE